MNFTCCFLGDMVHGGLNHGAEREDNCVIADQFQLAVWTLHQFLCALAFRIPSVQVHTVVGNHGRWPGQHKMPTKNRFSNLDHLVYASLQLSLKVHGLTNISMHLNDATPAGHRNQGQPLPGRAWRSPTRRRPAVWRTHPCHDA